MLNKVLENVSTIAIGGHVRPDGDCVGSCVGLGQYIRENYSDKTVDIYLKDIPESFHFLKGTETILESVDDEEKVYDLFISLDCGDTDRLEYSKTLFNKAKHTFCVDHHISNIGFADVNHIVPEASSTSELVYGLLDEAKISKMWRKHCTLELCMIQAYSSIPAPDRRHSGWPQIFWKKALMDQRS